MAHPESFERRTYTVREAAQVLGIGRDAFYAAVAAGVIPAIRVGRRIVVPRDVIERVLAEGLTLVSPTSATPIRLSTRAS